MLELLEPLQCAAMQHSFAFGFGLVIFLLTILLVSRRIIGFFLSLILMLLALGGTILIEHQDILYTWHILGPNPEQKAEAPTTTGINTTPSGATTTAPSTSRATPAPRTTAISPSTTESKAQREIEGQSGRQKNRIDQFLQGNQP